MEVELQEIRDFFAGRPPFDALPEEALDELPGRVEIRYLRRGSPFPPPGEAPRLFVVRTGAVALYDGEGRLRGKLGEGDLFSGQCVDLGTDGAWRGEALEDALLYEIPCEHVRRLRTLSEPFDRHFSADLRERLKQALGLVQDADGEALPWLWIELREVLRRPPVTVAAEASIRDAARRMTEERVSSVLVLEGERLAGLVTDSDLRRRCVARGLSVERPVREIMTPDPHTVAPDATVIQALTLMTRLQVHHLPVTAGGRLLGMFSTSDVARMQSAHPAYMVSDIAKAQDVEELAWICRRLPRLQAQLVAASASAQQVGEVVSFITDTLTDRLLALAEERLGPPPVPYVWVVGGSQSRREQSVHSDQDNALILSDDYEPGAHGEYFETLAREVSDGLNACGFPYCPGDAMATNPQWRQPLTVWRGYFRQWIERPEPKALMLTCIFFDLRPVRGATGLFEALQREVLERSRRNSIFLAHMVVNALTHRPPLGFFRTFVLIHDGKHDDTLDLKHRGTVPIVDMARVYALAHGLPAVGTIERLREAAQAGALSREMAENLEDAFEFIGSIRLRHQAAQIRRGEPPDNYVPPSELSELERRHLKDAFAAIQTLQEILARRYHVHSLS
jgi:CBS domain-containing protein